MSAPVTRNISIRLLYVDDDPQSTGYKDLRSRLHTHQFKVHHAPSVAAACRTLDSSIYHLVVVNVDRPQLYADVDNLLGKHPRTPVVGITAQILVPEHTDLVSLGMQDVICHPCAPEDTLAIRFRFAIERHGLRLDRKLVSSRVYVDQTHSDNVLLFQKAAEQIIVAADNYALARSAHPYEGS